MSPSKGKGQSCWVGVKQVSQYPRCAEEGQRPATSASEIQSSWSWVQVASPRGTGTGEGSVNGVWLQGYSETVLPVRPLFLPSTSLYFPTDQQQLPGVWPDKLTGRQTNDRKTRGRQTNQTGRRETELVNHEAVG